ncbi:MAG: DUF309 domain-containing protein [Pirellulales bacterium]
MTCDRRYAPRISFPPYSYVPGRFPHPLNDPRGHSYRAPGESHTDSLEAVEQNRYAVDLWNAGYYWEAHEAWESLWHSAGRTGAVADLYKGLIKLAAAGVKVREGLPNGVTRHLARASELFASVLAQVGDTTFAEHRPKPLFGLAETLAARNAVRSIETIVPDGASVVIVWPERIALAEPA